MDYQSVCLKDCMEIREIVSLHYFQYRSDFTFPGETHPFWEFVCVDAGEITAQAGEETYRLKKGDILFHAPNEFHSVKSDGKSSPSIVVISFYCDSPSIWRFQKKCLRISDKEKSLLAKIITEGKGVFAGRMDQPYQKKLLFLEAESFGGQQLIRQYLSEFLIQLYRRYFSYPLPMEAEDYYVEKSSRQSESYNRLVEYLESHVYEKLSMERICRDNLMGRSYVQKIFREVGNTGVMALFSKMKIDTAKRMIREGQLNLTQIADKLEFSSIHYFSRQFKKECKMSPSEYSSSIRSLSEERGD